MNTGKTFACYLGLTLSVLATGLCQDAPSVPFKGEIKSDLVNVRADSTISSEILCQLSRTEPIEVVSQSYEWYKIRLPKKTPCYIKKTLVSPIDDKTIKVLKDNVNIRLGPSESASIVGKAQKGELLHVLASQDEWFKIDPIASSTGWVHKKAVLPFRTGMMPASQEEPAPPCPEEKITKPLTAESPGTPSDVVAEGRVEPYGKVVNRIATHKLIISPTNAYLLRGNFKNLNALNYHLVRITGTVMRTTQKEKYPVLEIGKVELLN